MRVRRTPDMARERRSGWEANGDESTRTVQPAAAAVGRGRKRKKTKKSAPRVDGRRHNRKQERTVQIRLNHTTIHVSPPSRSDRFETRNGWLSRPTFPQHQHPQAGTPSLVLASCALSRSSSRSSSAPARVAASPLALAPSEFSLALAPSPSKQASRSELLREDTPRTARTHRPDGARIR